ncbi:DNA helicase PcrA [Babesia caballi]|uniref:DNA helicase PcrA n=1 Tax=Babesia caballi TaxID=5871 RepID=A0AAV4LTB3_BABCB|nr:DNA helicase PcrA [Babesia caballi]
MVVHFSNPHAVPRFFVSGLGRRAGGELRLHTIKLGAHRGVNHLVADTHHQTAHQRRVHLVIYNWLRRGAQALLQGGLEGVLVLRTELGRRVGKALYLALRGHVQRLEKLGQLGEVAGATLLEEDLETRQGLLLHLRQTQGFEVVAEEVNLGRRTETGVDHKRRELRRRVHSLVHVAQVAHHLVHIARVLGREVERLRVGAHDAAPIHHR